MKMISPPRARSNNSFKRTFREALKKKTRGNIDRVVRKKRQKMTASGGVLKVIIFPDVQLPPQRIMANIRKGISFLRLIFQLYNTSTSLSNRYRKGTSFL